MTVLRLRAAAWLAAVAVTAAAPAAAAQATSAPPPAARPTAAPGGAMGPDEITAFAKLQVAIAAVRDTIHAQLAQARNKTPQAQKQLQDRMRAEIAQLLHHNGVSDEDYRRRMFVVSSDAGARRAYDSTYARLTGAPIPGQVAASAAPSAAGPGAAVAVPAGAAGTHLGHLLNAFGDTPMGRGLIPTALAEARTAAQHAALAARDPANLDAMKTHAAHIVHAVDPSVVSSGPGLGYGVKRAAVAVAAHVEMAAAVAGAPASVTTHAAHVAIAARNTASRADQIVALARQVQAATAADAAAKLLNQIASLADQLAAGADANGDGRVTPVPGEAGLQIADQHARMMAGA